MLMSYSGWEAIRHFKPTEAWGDWKKMNATIFYMLDEMREEAGKPFVIHCGFESSGHTEKSQHYLGLAVDFHIVGMPLIDQYLLAERFPWSGIGIYPEWNSPGLHCDIRELDDYRGSRWGLIDGKYVSMDRNLIKRCIDVV